MTSSNSAASTPKPLRRPPVAIHFAPGRPPMWPRLMPWRRTGKVAARYLLLAMAFLWVFGGTLFFMLRFIFLFYGANQRPIQSLFDRLFR